MSWHLPWGSETCEHLRTGGIPAETWTICFLRAVVVTIWANLLNNVLIQVPRNVVTICNSTENQCWIDFSLVVSEYNLELRFSCIVGAFCGPSQNPIQIMCNFSWFRFFPNLRLENWGLTPFRRLSLSVLFTTFEFGLHKECHDYVHWKSIDCEISQQFTIDSRS